MLVLLDRDGVINEDIFPNGVTSPNMLCIFDNTLPALQLLKDHGAQIAVVTNQSAIGKGLLTEAGLGEIHAIIQSQCHNLIDKFYYCADHPSHPTSRRKPGDGMLQEALADFGADAKRTPFIGDSATDIQAAHKTRCPAILVGTGKGDATHKRLGGAGYHYCADIFDAARYIVTHEIY